VLVVTGTAADNVIGIAHVQVEAWQLRWLRVSRLVRPIGRLTVALNPGANVLSARSDRLGWQLSPAVVERTVTFKPPTPSPAVAGIPAHNPADRSLRGRGRDLQRPVLSGQRGDPGQFRLLHRDPSHGGAAGAFTANILLDGGGYSVCREI
jgi:hypothetical protein